MLLPQSSEGGLEESHSLLLKLFDFMGTLLNVQRFAFWYEVLKVHFLNIFYAELKASKNPDSPGKCLALSFLFRC